MPDEQSTFELIAKVAFESNLESAKETTSQLSKQDNLVNELTAHQKELETQIKKTADPTTVEKLNKEFAKSEKIITKQQKAVQDQIKKTTDTIEKSINSVDFGKFKKIFTGDEFKNLDKQITDAKTDMAQLAILTEAFKGKLGTLDAGTNEFHELSAVIAVSEATLKEFASAEELVAGKSKPVKTQLREVRDAMDEMELAGKANTKEFRALANQAGILQDQIDATTQRVKILSSDTKNLDFGIETIQTAVGLFEIGAGAAAIFGVEQEELEEIQTKLIAAMSLVNGLQQIQNALQKEGTLRVVGHELATKAAATAQRAYAIVVGTSTGALKAFKVALATTGIGLIVVAVGYLVSHWDDLTKSVTESNAALKSNKEVIDKAADSYAQARSNVEQLGLKLKQVEENVISKDEALKFYNDTIGKTTGEITDLTEAEDFYNAGAQDYIDFMFLKAKATAAAGLAQEEFKKSLQEEVKTASEYVSTFETILGGFAAGQGLSLFPSAKDLKNRQQEAISESQSGAKRFLSMQEAFTKQANEISKRNGWVSRIDKPKTKAQAKKDLKKIAKDINKDPEKIKFDIELDSARETLPEEIARFKKEATERLNKAFAKKEDREAFIEVKPKLSDADAAKFQKEIIDYLQNDKKLNEAFSPDFIQGLESDADQENIDLENSKENFRQKTILAAQYANDIIQIEIDKSNRLIAIQQQRLSEAEANQEDSNEINVKAERDRLDKLREEKEKHVRAQRIIDAAIIAANQAVAISAAIKGIAVAAGEGGAGAAFTIAANVAALVAGLAAVGLAVNNATSDIPEFYEGGFTGDGNPREKSKALGKRPYTYHKGEFVMPHDLTAQYRDLFEGIHSRDLVVHDTGQGYSVVPKRLDVGAIANDHNSVKMFYNTSNNAVVESRLKSIENILRSKETSVTTNMDSNGFALSVQDSISQINLTQKRR